MAHTLRRLASSRSFPSSYPRTKLSVTREEDEEDESREREENEEEEKMEEEEEEEVDEGKEENGNESCRNENETGGLRDEKMSTLQNCDVTSHKWTQGSDGEGEGSPNQRTDSDPNDPYCANIPIPTTTTTTTCGSTAVDNQIACRSNPVSAHNTHEMYTNPIPELSDPVSNFLQRSTSDVNANIREPIASNVQEPRTSPNFNESSTFNFHDQAQASNFHELGTSNFREPMTSNFHEPETSYVHDEPMTSDFHEQVTSNLHDEAATSNFGEPAETTTVTAPKPPPPHNVQPLLSTVLRKQHQQGRRRSSAFDKTDSLGFQVDGQSSPPGRGSLEIGEGEEKEEGRDTCDGGGGDGENRFFWADGSGDDDKAKCDAGVISSVPRNDGGGQVENTREVKSVDMVPDTEVRFDGNYSFRFPDTSRDVPDLQRGSEERSWFPSPRIGKNSTANSHEDDDVFAAAPRPSTSDDITTSLVNARGIDTTIADDDKSKTARIQSPDHDSNNKGRDSYDISTTHNNNDDMSTSGNGENPGGGGGQFVFQKPFPVPETPAPKTTTTTAATTTTTGTTSVSETSADASSRESEEVVMRQSQRELAEIAALPPSPLPPPPPAVIDDTPPPLPSRPPPLASRRTIEEQQTLPSGVGSGATQSEVSSRSSLADISHGSFDDGSVVGSNDSDFVSAEVIMQIRNLHTQKMNREMNIASASRGEVLGGPFTENSSTPGPSGAASGASSTLTHSPQSRTKPKLKPKPERLKKSPTNGSSGSLDKLSDSNLSFTSSLSQSPDADFQLTMANMVSESDDILENVYSCLPSNVPLVSEASDTDERLEQEEKAKEQEEKAKESRSKPIPRPRRALSNRIKDESHPVESSQGAEGGQRESLDVATIAMDEDFDLEVFTGCISNTESEESMQNEYSVLGEVRNMLKKPCTSVKEIPFEVTPKSTGAKVSESYKEGQTRSSKDENENFYGLMCEASLPPTTQAPPVPPLPQRHDSLPRNFSAQRSKLSPTPSDVGLKSSTLPSDISGSVVVSSRTSSSPSSSSSSSSIRVESSQAPADHNSHSDEAPPLPLPRRKVPATTTNNTTVSRNSLPPHALSSSISLDIPPMPPRYPSPKRSFTVEENRPPLPSRNSQSFVIKRPQLTVPAGVDGPEGAIYSTSKKASATDIADSTQDPSVSKGHATGNGASGLSRKMLLDRAHSMHTVVSLKQTQAEILQTEINLPSVCVNLTQKSGHGLALVEYGDAPCVVGWNQKDFPSLHGKLHIGDLLFSINKIKVNSTEMAYKLLKHVTDPKIEVVMRRMPFAKVFAIRRSAEGQSLGIKREGGTGEIIYVDPNGLAANHGLPSYANSSLKEGRCNWFLTEINNRPLSLFFKENEIDHRLSAVGREISIVVQPSDFIHEIRKKFKKMKNYKSYITQ
ncbi:mucin-17 [Aplysia californica]|uniref:Mucin-17 n=1 Tax=Aplysia californica TaxID=6500 RepID=A0ABM1A251_APLCA|nr:mucin-17 [Aplysia californica]